MLGLVLGLGMRLGGSVVLPSCVSGGKGKNQNQRPCQWWRLYPMYASQTQILNPNFPLSERQKPHKCSNTPSYPR